MELVSGGRRGEEGEGGRRGGGGGERWTADLKAFGMGLVKG